MVSEFQCWTLHEEARIATLALNRPEESNKLNLETFVELREITDRLDSEDDVWVVVIEGKGGHFSTGVDPALIHVMIDYPEQPFRKAVFDIQRTLDAFEALEKPTIAKLHGFCLGGGLILALCCDFRIASHRTVFGLPEVKRGIPVLTGSHRVTRMVGMAVAKELILLGKNLNASAAKELGLLHKVVPSDQLDKAVKNLAQQLLRLPPRTLSAAKRIINEGSFLSSRESQDLEIEAMSDLLDSPDFKEAINSFIEGRSPTFIGE